VNAPLDASFVPAPARIAEVIAESHDTRTFVLAPTGGASVTPAAPGQFVMLSLLGSGEAAFTPSGWNGTGPAGAPIRLTVRRVGSLTTALFALGAGDVVGLRGPFGRGFPDWPADADLLFVAGGCGLAPLRAAIEARIARRAPSSHLTIVYGARTPATRIFRTDLERWRSMPAVTVLDYVEHADATWRGRTGDVPQALDVALAQRRPDFAAVCGPPAMMVAAAARLVAAGTPQTHVSLAIERQMKCGVGLCGHCYVGHRLACVHGPVFSLRELARIDASFTSLPAPPR
jgi:NAD(P)H-flavin reductase